MTVTTFNYEGSYLPGVICNVVKADLGRWTPGELRIDALNTAISNLADKHTLANGLPSPSESRIDTLNTATPNLADEPTLADGPPSESRIDVLNTAKPNVADEPTLANATDVYWSRMAISHCY